MRRVAIVLFSTLCLCVTGLSTPTHAADGLDQTQVAQVIANVRATLSGLTYDSPQVAGKIAPSRFAYADVTHKRIAIAKATGRNFTEVTDDEAKRELQKEYVAGSGYAQAFADVQANLETYLTQVISSDSRNSGRNADYYTSTIQAKPAEVLLGLTYEQRLYDFDYGQTNFAQGLRTSGSFGKAFNPLDVAIALGSQTGDQYAMPKNVETFTRVLAGTVSNERTLGALITSVVPADEVDDWYAGQLVAHGNAVAENASPSVVDGTYRLYSKLVSSAKLLPYLLPLATRTNSDMYVLSNVSSVSLGMREGYVADKTNTSDMAAFTERVAQYGRDQAAYVDFWARMAPEFKDSLKTDRIVTDGYFVAGRGTGKEAWSPRGGADAAQAVKDFFGPMKLWSDHKFVGAEASGADITFWIARLLAPSGSSAYSHELTHQLAQNPPHAYLKGHRHRSGTSTELLPRGLYETYEYNDPIYQLNQIMNWPADGYANSTVTSFTDEASVKNYMKNLLDVTNTLDLIEAQEVLTRDTATKQKWFNIVTLTPSKKPYTGKYDETFTASRAQDAANWTSVNDLVGANAVVSRYEAVGLQHTGTAPYNGYPTIPLFSPLYGAPQSSEGTTGDIHMRRIAWELLGEYGLSNGWVPYLSDQYKPAGTPEGALFADSEVLKKISPYSSDAEFRKAMFAQREAQLDELSAVEITYGGQTIKVDSVAKLRELMKSAVDHDLADTRTGIRARDTHVERLKSAIYLAYKAQTHEFSTSIYSAPVTYGVTYRFDGDVPQDVTAPVTTQKYRSGQTVQASLVTSTSLEHRGVDGTWVFNGWKVAGSGDVVTQASVTDHDIEFVGSWTFTPHTYTVTYRIDGDMQPTNPPAVPVDDATYTTGDTVTVQPALTTSATMNNGVPGTWVFTGWMHNGSSVDQVTVNKANVELVGMWVFTPAHQRTVTFVYKAADGSPTLPAALKAPEPVSGYEGSNVTLPSLPQDYKDAQANGTWHFAVWNPVVRTFGGEDVTVTGTWEFTPDPVDLTQIQAAVTAARQALTEAMVSVDGSDVPANKKWTTQDNVDAFTALLDRVQAAIDGGKLTSHEAETMRQMVARANADFIHAQQAGTQTTTPVAPEPKPGIPPQPEAPEKPAEPGPATVTVTPVAPSGIVPDASDPRACTVAPFVTIPDVEGVAYTINGRVVEVGDHAYEYGATVVVTAEPKPGYSFGEGVRTRWTWSAPARAELGCDAPGSEPTVTPGASPTEDPLSSTLAPQQPIGGSAKGIPVDLPNTGSNVIAASMIAFILLSAGVVVLLRRKQRAGH